MKGKKNDFVREIDRKIRLPIAVLGFVVVTLFAVILYQSVPVLPQHLSFLADMSIQTVLAIAAILSLVGLSLSWHMSQVVIRVIHDYSNKLERMLGITRDLREEMYGDILLEKILDSAISVARADAGSILLIENGKLVFKTVRGEKSRDLLGTSVEKGSGLAGWIAESGQTVRVADVTKDERFNPEIDNLTGYNTKALMGVPLISGSRIIGVLELLNNKDKRPFRERDEEIISYLAGQAAISILKTRFYEDQKNYEIHLTELLLDAIEIHIVEKKDHSKRVAGYSNIIARELCLPDDQRKKLYHASLLHDIGFLKISPENSFKKEEYVKHPVIGYEMISPITFYSDIAPFILHHHERIDGRGYPSRLKGEEIPLEARIIAIAEAFDAMTSRTSYKVPMGFKDAVAELRNRAGAQFDAKLVEIFAGNIDQRHVTQ
ncbi:MAG: GAF domain-containing protein [Nitrospirae bacterium]|nr:GAF domain-containing protein [Nitrospirota bacterium]